jgi:hypothetical protein
VVAVCITAIAVFSLIALQLGSMRWKSKSSDRQHASLIAGSVLNEKVSMLRLNFDQSVSQSQAPVPDTKYRLEVRESQEDLQLKKVEVEVNWRDAQGDQRYILTTRVCREH